MLLISLLALSITPGAGVFAAPLAAKTDTPTPAETATDQPTPGLATETPTPAATPWGVMILVTPTPNRKPPSLQIPDLGKKIKKAGLPDKLVFALNPQPSYQTSPIPEEVDQAIQTFWDWLELRQQRYFSSAGKYAQMFSSHLTIPADGVHQYPDGWYSHPSDQQYTWDDLQAIQFEPLPFAITIDVYDGPEGPGYVGCFTMGLGGQLWRRCVVYGAESLRKREWGIVQ